jgi:hypothetical protein
MTEETLPEKPTEGAPSMHVRGKGPRKQEGLLRQRRIKGKLLMKPKVTKGGKKGVATKKAGVRMGRARLGTEQVGLKQTADAPEGYVRFRVRVEDEKMTIVDSQLVDSTLIAPAAVYGNFAYEVTHGQARLHVDSIPDIGGTRSFANPEGPREEQRHNITELSNYEFDVRVPVKELTSTTLPEIDIALYRVKERTQSMAPGPMPLNVQFERELREVARLQGIPSDALPPSMRRKRPPRARKAK